MEALQTVFDTIKKVLDIIRNFFEEIFPKKEDDDAEAAA